MKRPRKTKNLTGRAARLLFVVGLLLSLSSFQVAWAAIACLCQSASRAESCECAHGCDPTMHENGTTGATHDYPETKSSIKWDVSPRTHSMSCCERQQQSEKPVMTFTSPSTVEVEDSPAIVLPTAIALAYAIRTHDPPRSRPLYVTHSCLLI